MNLDRPKFAPVSLFGVLALVAMFSSACGPAEDGERSVVVPRAGSAKPEQPEAAIRAGAEARDQRIAGEALAAASLVESSPELWFEDIAATSGLHFVHVSGHDGDYFMPEIMGGGVALLDADGDGRLDVYCVQSGGVLGVPGARPGNQLFLQRDDDPARAGSLHFVDVSEQSGADHRGYGMGATAGDADNDGDVDLYVTNWGANALLLNEGTASFRDVSAASGAAHEGWGTSSAFVDVDTDGDLDLFVVNYLDWSPEGELTCHNDLGLLDWCSPQNYESAARDVLLSNQGDGTFVDVSEASGVASVPGTGLGVGCGDFDSDGNIDLFVANDGMPDALWMGDGDGSFADNALLAGCAVDYSGKAKAGMGVALADIDDDADLDLIVCNLDRQSDSFFVNQGGWFEDKTPRVGLGRRSQPFTRFGMGLLDFDLDGHLDLFQANGRVAFKADLHGEDPLGEPDLLQPGRAPNAADAPGAEAWFTSADTADGTASPPALVGRGAAFGDLDNDGAVDIVVINKDGPARLLRNIIGPARWHGPGSVEASEASKVGVVEVSDVGDRAADRGDQHHWLGLAVLDEHGRHALGATVTLQVGLRTITRDVRAAYSYLASSDPRVHFGLGILNQPAGSPAGGDVSVRWPDGERESFGQRALDDYHTLRRGEGEPAR